MRLALLALAGVAAVEIALRCGLPAAYRRIAILLRRMPGVIGARPRREIWKERAVRGLSVRLWGALGRATLLLILVLAPVVAVAALDPAARSLLVDVPAQIGLFLLLVLYALVTRPFRKRLRLRRAPAA
ncbi:MAG TPA: hypothetical protein VF638_12860 [Sphingomonas sp.]|jgi:hypothetical protein